MHLWPQNVCHYCALCASLVHIHPERSLSAVSYSECGMRLCRKRVHCHIATAFNQSPLEWQSTSGRRPSHSDTPPTPPADRPLLSRLIRHCSLLGGRVASRILVSGEMPCFNFTSTTHRAKSCAAAIFCARSNAFSPSLAVGFTTLCRRVCP